jgi:prepilin-type N-terminal cleavage/methylation domain-containing protein
MKPLPTHRRGFTLVEVLLATLLLSVVGVAAVTFLGAFATGGVARRQASDAALESTLAVQRFRTLAPRLRCVLQVSDTHALLWLSDLVPSRSVHASEAGILWFDEERGELLLELIDPETIAVDRSLEREYAIDEFDDLLEDLTTLRARGALLRSILAEGIEQVEFKPDPVDPSGVRLTFITGGGTAAASIAPAIVEEPFG